MKNINYKPRGICARLINFNIDDDNKIRDLKFLGGCNGNLKAMAILLEGSDAKETADKLSGNDCGGRGTSCADQLSKAIYEAID
ncbi:MAG: TIGR03905 family TSCPD domain-containing protein [Hornefia sp.]|nr:TIGR03905 family TSCPD domain-containing protein [Hornefia sp.]